MTASQVARRPAHIEELTDQFDTFAPRVFFGVGLDASWKDRRVWRVFYRVAGSAEGFVRAMLGRDRQAVLRRLAEHYGGPTPVRLIVYKVLPPPTAEQVAFIESCNGRLRK